MEKKLTSAAEQLPQTQLEFSVIQAATPCRTIGKVWRALAACAAAIALMICVGLGGYAYAEEAKEYEAAVQFFDENGLSTEGLTRGQIKAVYRDITTQTFSYRETVEVILSSKLVGGYEIQQEALSREDLLNIWNYREPKQGVQYRVLPLDNPPGYLFQQCDGETVLWSVDCSEYLYPKYTEVSDGVLVYGCHIEERQALIAKYDLQGNLLWYHQPDNGFDREEICVVIENEDGSYVAVGGGQGGVNHVCVSLYTADGERILYNATKMGGTPMDIAHFGDGYMVKLGSGAIIKMDRQGNILDSFRYESDQWEYCWIQDMIEYDGKIYLSAYVTPKLSEEERDFGGRVEIARILQYVSENKVYTGEGLAAAARENYTALLLVCDGENGVPQEFYSVPGSRGGLLEIDEAGCLAWEVHNITDVEYVPFTNAYSIIGTCYVHSYSFSQSGKLLYRYDTENIAQFAI